MKKKLKVIPPYKIVVVCTYNLVFLRHWPPRAPLSSMMKGVIHCAMSMPDYTHPTIRLIESFCETRWPSTKMTLEIFMNLTMKRRSEDGILSLKEVVYLMTHHKGTNVTLAWMMIIDELPLCKCLTSISTDVLCKHWQ